MFSKETGFIQAFASRLGSGSRASALAYQTELENELRCLREDGSLACQTKLKGLKTEDLLMNLEAPGRNTLVVEFARRNSEDSGQNTPPPGPSLASTKSSKKLRRKTSLRGNKSGQFKKIRKSFTEAAAQLADDLKLPSSSRTIAGIVENLGKHFFDSFDDKEMNFFLTYKNEKEKRYRAWTSQPHVLPRISTLCCATFALFSVHHYHLKAPGMALMRLAMAGMSLLLLFVHWRDREKSRCRERYHANVFYFFVCVFCLEALHCALQEYYFHSHQEAEEHCSSEELFDCSNAVFGFLEITLRITGVVVASIVARVLFWHMLLLAWVVLVLTLPVAVIWFSSPHPYEDTARGGLGTGLLVLILLVVADHMRRTEHSSRTKFQHLSRLDQMSTTMQRMLSKMLPRRFLQSENGEMSSVMSGDDGVASSAPSEHDLTFSRCHSRLMTPLPSGASAALRQPVLVVENYPHAIVMFVSFEKDSFKKFTSPSAFFRVLGLVVSAFDYVTESSGMYKVEHIGEDYVVGPPSIHQGPGYPVTWEQHIRDTANMLHLGVKLLGVAQQSQADLPQQLQYKVGIHIGSLIGAVAGRSRRFYRLFGDTMNTAARMCHHCPINEVQVSADVFELVGDDPSLLWHDNGEMQIKGKGAMQTFLVTTQDGYLNNMDDEAIACPPRAPRISEERDSCLEAVRLSGRAPRISEERDSCLEAARLPRLSTESAADSTTELIKRPWSVNLSLGSISEVQWSMRSLAMRNFFSIRSLPSLRLPHHHHHLQTKKSQHHEDKEAWTTLGAFKHRTTEKKYLAEQRVVSKRELKQHSLLFSLTLALFFGGLAAMAVSEEERRRERWEWKSGYLVIAAAGLVTVLVSIGEQVWEFVLRRTTGKPISLRTNSRGNEESYLRNFDTPMTSHSCWMFWHCARVWSLASASCLALWSSASPMALLGAHLLAVGVVRTSPPVLLFAVTAIGLLGAQAVILFTQGIAETWLEMSVLLTGPALVLVLGVAELLHLHKSNRQAWKVKRKMLRQSEMHGSLFADLIPHRPARLFLLMRLGNRESLIYSRDSGEDFSDKKSFGEGSETPTSHAGGDSQTDFAHDTLAWCGSKGQKAVVLSTDLVGFTPLAQRLGPEGVVRLLHDMWCCMDLKVQEDNSMFKMDTVGDAYVVIKLVDKATDKSLEEAAELMLDLSYKLYASVQSLKNEGSGSLPSMQEIQDLEIRMGMHLGPVASGLVGYMQPRYHVYGPTVNIAAQMEGEAKPGHLLLSPEVATILSTEQRLYTLKRRVELNRSLSDDNVEMHRNDRLKIALGDGLFQTESRRFANLRLSRLMQNQQSDARRGSAPALLSVPSDENCAVESSVGSYNDHVMRQASVGSMSEETGCTPHQRLASGNVMRRERVFLKGSTFIRQNSYTSDSFSFLKPELTTPESSGSPMRRRPLVNTNDKFRHFSEDVLGRT